MAREERVGGTQAHTGGMLHLADVRTTTVMRRFGRIIRFAAGLTVSMTVSVWAGSGLVFI